MAQLIIEAGRSDRQYWHDLWRYRELFYVLAWRDIRIRYKQTVIGVAWAVIQPLLSMLIFSLIFGHWAKLPSIPGVPYMLMVLAGMLPWQFFSNALGGASQSVLGNTHLISKVYFPRLIVPGGAIVTALVDLAVSFVLLLVFLAVWRVWPTWRFAFLPAFVLMAVAAAFGPGLFLTALIVRFRDFRFVLPFLLQLGTYLSPVGFSSGIVPGPWRPLYYLNPMVAVIDGFRWSALGARQELYLPGLGISLAVTVLFAAFGVWFFRRTERSFADIL